MTLKKRIEETEEKTQNLELRIANIEAKLEEIQQNLELRIANLEAKHEEEIQSIALRIANLEAKNEKIKCIEPTPENSPKSKKKTSISSLQRIRTIA